MLNRDLFTKITIDDEEKVTIEAAEPVATILDTVAKTKNGNVRTPSRVEAGQGSNVADYVELRGIEPLTYSMRTSRATNCAIAPGDRERSTVCHCSSLTGSLSKPAGAGVFAR